jgi:hypothetical protein
MIQCSIGKSSDLANSNVDCVVILTLNTCLGVSMRAAGGSLREQGEEASHQKH